MAASRVGHKNRGQCASSLIDDTACSILIPSILFPFYGKISLPSTPRAPPTPARVYHLYCIPISFLQPLFQYGQCCYEVPVGRKTGEQESNRNEVKKETPVYFQICILCASPSYLWRNGGFIRTIQNLLTCSLREILPEMLIQHLSSGPPCLQHSTSSWHLLSDHFPPCMRILIYSMQTGIPIPPP